MLCAAAARRRSAATSVTSSPSIQICRSSRSESRNARPVRMGMNCSLTAPVIARRVATKQSRPGAHQAPRLGRRHAPRKKQGNTGKTPGEGALFSCPGEARFKLCVSPPADLDGLSPAQLKELVAILLEKMAELERQNAERREEIARLKGLKGRPDVKPSGMDEATELPGPGMQGKRRGGGKVRQRVVVEDRIIKASVPAGGELTRNPVHSSRHFYRHGRACPGHQSWHLPL